jgi:3'-phosphoadenosine 5'-phosphosulfate sulfotransferase (PAPS reductase)/FAD synthetase
MNPLNAPPETDFTFLSLGAGVQSSTLALMAAHGEVTPMPDAAIFADTQAEPASVYKWLDWLEPQLPFPVIRVTRGDMTSESLIIKDRKDGTGRWSKSLIPAFIQNKDGSKGIMGRQCTYSYKVEQLERAARLHGKVKRGQKNVTVTQWIGISWDEIQRIKPSRVAWSQHRWPLVELRMGRRDCLKWMESHGYPKPPRSACVYCPFHSDNEWRRLRDEEPEEFQRAIRFEKDLQEVKAKTERMRGIPFLHPSCVPLDQVDLSTDIERGQLSLWLDEQSFGNECEGMCGV